MKKWKLNLKNRFVGELYDKYLARVDHITTLYSVVLQTQMNPQMLDDSLEIPLSKNFSKGFTTIKSKNDIVHCIQSGELQQINCYQAVVSIVSNFEDLMDRFIESLSISSSEINSAAVSVRGVDLPSPLLKKVKAIHCKLSISSPAIGDHESHYYYKIIRLRNCIVHKQGCYNKKDEALIGNWIRNGKVEFNGNNIDDIVHFFLMPVRSMILTIDEVLQQQPRLLRIS